MDESGTFRILEICSYIFLFVSDLNYFFLFISLYAYFSHFLFTDKPIIHGLQLARFIIVTL